MSLSGADTTASPLGRGTSTSRFTIMAALVVLLAFLIREYYVLVSVVEIPIRGDVREYVLYAWNLYHHGTFSLSEPGTVAPVADAYRSPGFPWLLALCMWLRPIADGWYGLALQMQVALGTATVLFALLAGRRWLRPGWTILTGLLLAVWPHHVAATGVLLSEVAFGCALMAGLACLASALDRRTTWLFALAGACLAAAYLINPLIALFPPAIALFIWRIAGSRKAMALLVAFLIPVLGFAIRNAAIDHVADPQHPVGRAAMNFVQGSWPQYHQAWSARYSGDVVGIQILDAMEKETARLQEDPRAGLTAIEGRLSSDPGYYATWYLLRKPFLLWDWNIRVGYGGPYVLPVQHSPLESNLVLRICALTLQRLNGVLTLVAFAGMFGVLATAARGRVSAAAIATAGLMAYATAIHMVFQAEPRYATAYRGIELLMVATTCQQILLCALRLRRNRSGRIADMTRGVTSAEQM